MKKTCALICALCMLTQCVHPAESPRKMSPRETESNLADSCLTFFKIENSKEIGGYNYLALKPGTENVYLFKEKPKFTETPKEVTITPAKLYIESGKKLPTDKIIYQTASGEKKFIVEYKRVK